MLPLTLTLTLTLTSTLTLAPLSTPYPRRFGSHSGVVEYAYNLRDALHRYQRHVDCKLFLKVLEGSVPEAVREDGLAQLEKLIR
jgi:hypothetical protein